MWFQVCFFARTRLSIQGPSGGVFRENRRIIITFLSGKLGEGEYTMNILAQMRRKHLFILLQRRCTYVVLYSRINCIYEGEWIWVL